MATIVSAGSGNWSAGATWVGGSKPTTGDDVEIAAGHTVTLDENTAVLGAEGIKNVSGSNTSVLDISGTRTINANVSYSGTSTTGFVTYGTGDVLTINGQVTQSGATGYCVVGSGTGQLVISNVGGTAVLCSISGRGVYHNSTGEMTITGAVTSAGGQAIRCQGGTNTVTGTVSSSGGYALQVNGGTTTVDGNVGGSGSINWAIYVAGGTVNWTGARSVAASHDSLIVIQAGTLNLATASAALTLTNSGTFVIERNAGTLVTTAAGGTASITNQAATSYAAIIGGTDEQKAIIVGPTIPAEADVESGTEYGYADDLQTGTLVAGGGGGFVQSGSGRFGVQEN